MRYHGLYWKTATDLRPVSEERRKQRQAAARKRWGKNKRAYPDLPPWREQTREQRREYNRRKMLESRARLGGKSYYTPVIKIRSSPETTAGLNLFNSLRPPQCED